MKNIIRDIFNSAYEKVLNDKELVNKIAESIKADKDKVSLSDAMFLPSVIAFERSVKISAEVIKEVLDSEELKEKFYDEMYEEMKKRFKEEQKRIGEAPLGKL